MRDHNSYQGKVYRISPNQWDEDISVTLLQLPKAVKEHMVIVVGRAKTQPHWLEVVTITKSFSSKINKDLYIPIAPSPMNRRAHTQLHFCDDPYGNASLPFNSYVRVDEVYQVPQYVLEEVISWHRHLELKQSSYNALISSDLRFLL
ncbi:hypothetical protein J3F84DRAFT_368212 [Trichoderma pleuroticola]